jgi:hypothetical protein
MALDQDAPSPPNEGAPQAGASKPFEAGHDAGISSEAALSATPKPYQDVPQRQKLLDAMYCWIHSR